MDEHGRVAQDEAQEIYLSDIVAALLRRKWLILGCVVLSVLAGLLYAIFTTPLYTAQTTLQPATEQDGQLGGLAQRFGGAAALAGINIGGGGGGDRAEYLAILRSRELAERFIELHDLKPKLFPERWNATAGKWAGEVKSGGVRVWLSRLLADLSGDEGWAPPSGPEPSMWEAYKEFSGILQIAEENDTGLVSVEIRFRNPGLAAQWANDYVALANEQIRRRAIEEASRALDYLDDEVQRTSVAGVRETIFGLVEGQLEKIMLANARPEFAFKVLDRAVVPEERSHPRRGLIVMLTFMLGGMLGIFGALVVAAWQSELRRDDRDRSTTEPAEKGAAS